MARAFSHVILEVLNQPAPSVAAGQEIGAGSWSSAGWGWGLLTAVRGAFVGLSVCNTWYHGTGWVKEMHFKDGVAKGKLGESRKEGNQSMLRCLSQSLRKWCFSIGCWVTGGIAGSIFCFTKDGNTLLNLNSSNFQLSGSYSNPVKCICDTEMDSIGCDGVCGIRVHFPTVVVSLWAAFLQPVQLCLAMGMLVLKLWSPECHSLGATALPAVGTCQPSRLWVNLLFSWDPGVRQKVNTVGARQEREGCSGGRGWCHGRSHFCRLLCTFCSPPVHKLCWRKGLMYRDIRQCQSRAVSLHSSTECCIWEESLNYSLTCITACKSVYNQGLGLCLYLWMSRAESGRDSSTDTVCELHNCCEHMTLLLQARPWDGRDIWQGLCSLLWAAHPQWGLLLYTHKTQHT